MTIYLTWLNGDGTTDDTAALQAAINTGENIVLPKNRIYRITAPLTTATPGQRITGENPLDTLISTAGGTTFDILRIAHSDVEVSGLLFRPGGANPCIRVYAASAYIHRNRFLSPSNNAGQAIILTDTNPVTGAFVAGSYTHVIERNQIGYDGYAFATAIQCNANTGGIQATKFLNNKFCGDKFIDMAYGGGNYYSGNLFQSSTGITETPAGDCLSFGADVSGEKIVGNYFERYACGIKSTRTVNTYRIVTALGNEYDNCTASVIAAAGITNLINDGMGIVGGGGGGTTYSKLTGTLVGDLTSGGGLSAATDGNTAQGWTPSARIASGNSGSIGLSFSSAKTVTRAKIWFSTDYGADSTTSTGINITAALKGWNGSSWVTLYTTTFADTNNSHAIDTTSIVSGSYGEVRWFISNDNSGSNPPVVAEFELYETI